MARAKLPQIPARLSQIDDVTRPDHYYLETDDVCYHLWDYFSPGDVREHPTNQLIQNLKIPIAVRISNLYRWQHKLDALEYAAKAMGHVVPADYFQYFTWIPIPPSCPKGTPEYDARLRAVLRKTIPVIPDIRELLIQTVQRTSKEKGLQPSQRASDLEIVETLAEPTPARIMLFDDVLTTGCHFKAAQAVLQARFPEVAIGGVFLARVRRPAESTAIDTSQLEAIFASIKGDK